ncbi:substrate-binding domain-containing protein [Clostridium felsineum]|uniref:substrate-binding domain-containing protein n=1 Tax=Clostridium felsineum TaxID=36839 RepID=UPI0009C8B4ED|nr:substrate-binding domain-containing protein [Clostridium felsineum]URZ01103.1 HTH-type transcriptional repressor PurR [Clostridium felsineum]
MSSASGSHYQVHSGLSPPSCRPCWAHLKSEKRPSGIFCYNDEIAYIVLTIADKLNIKVPEELSIVGFDDSSLAEIMQPNLTTITHPKEQMGKDAANLIISLINNNNHFEASDSILYEPELVIRNSTAKLK